MTEKTITVRNADITYIIGAGASANVIPTVKKFPAELRMFSSFIQNENSFRELNKTDFLDDLGDLIIESEKHASIDTYAKKLYLTNETGKLKKLKALLDSFLTAFQITNDLDIRYDLFIATLLSNTTGKLQLPDNINIISWNYDFQFELSLNNFFQFNGIQDLEKKINIWPNNNFNNKENEFSIIKLNGTAGGLIENEKIKRKNFFSLSPNYNIELHNKIKVYQDIIKNYYATMSSKSISSIMFAWENDNLLLELRKNTKNKISQTEVLVVIGYSFPTFNREVDRLLLSGMYKLQKIFIQVPENDMNSVKLRVRSLLHNGIYPDINEISATDEFFIPFEL